MNYWRINTDSSARDDVRTCDLWYKHGMAFAGDFIESKRMHDAIFKKFSPGDGVFMHQSRLGVVGYGIVKEKWNGETYKGRERRLYEREDFEYRIAIDWETDCDCRENPLAIHGLLPYMGTYSQVDPITWKVESVIQDLRNRSTQKKSTGSEKAVLRGPIKRIRPKTDEIQKILSCIGKRVSFKYPGNEGDKHGILKDRVVIESTNEPGTVPYWDVVDLIEFKGEKEPQWLRIGYYRRPKHTLNWGSQTTITEPISIWKKVLVEAAREKEWFRELLDDVISELKK